MDSSVDSIEKRSSVNMDEEVSMYYDIKSFVAIPRSGITCYKKSSFSSFLENIQTDFQNGFTGLNSAHSE